MKTKFLLSLSILISTLVLSITTMASGHMATIDVAKLKSGAQTLKVGYIADYPPFYFPNTNPVRGMDADIFREVAQRAGIQKIEFVKFSNFSALNHALETDKIDIIANDYWDIPSHRGLFLLTTPYYQGDGIGIFFVKDKFSFKKIDDLQNRPVGVDNNSSDIVAWVQTHPIKNANIKFYDSLNDLDNALNQGKIDAALTYYSFSHAHISKNGPYEVILLKSIPSTFAVRRQDIGLQSTLNKALDCMSSDGTLAKLEKKYLTVKGAY